MLNQYFKGILPYFFFSKRYDISFSAQKFHRRHSSLKAMPWSKAVGSIDYTSFDESDWSEDENSAIHLECANSMDTTPPFYYIYKANSM